MEWLTLGVVFVVAFFMGGVVTGLLLLWWIARTIHHAVTEGLKEYGEKQETNVVKIGDKPVVGTLLKEQPSEPSGNVKSRWFCCPICHVDNLIRPGKPFICQVCGYEMYDVPCPEFTA
jgi:hypothetical protein